MGVCCSKPQAVPPTAEKASNEEHGDGIKSSNPRAYAPNERQENSKVDYAPPGKTVDEEKRLELLRALNILDSEKEDRFSAITSLRQWFKAAEGLNDVCETSRDVSFCGHTILPSVPQLMVIEDTLEDARFAGNPLVVNPPKIRFYAGAPLVSSANGYRYGALCVIDVEPHKNLPAELYNMLAQFSELVVREIEKDKLALLQKMVTEHRSISLSGTGTSPLGSGRSSTVSDLAEREWGLSRAADCFVEGVMLVDVSSANWTISYTNAAFSTALSIPRDEAVTQGFWDLFTGPGLNAATCREAVAANEPFSITVQLQSIYCQTPKWVTVDFRSVANAQLGVVGLPAGVNSPSTPPPALPVTTSSPLYYFALVQPESLKSESKRRLNLIAGDHPTPQPSALKGRPADVHALTKAMPTAFTDVRLGPLIGRGAYGRVYRGSWNGNTVAVKVMETTERMTRGDDDAAHNKDCEDKSVHGARGLFEAILSSALSHPNVVHTYQYAVRPLSGPPPVSEATWGAPGKPSHQRSLNEVWIISEFCNRGPLLTAVERGAFLTQPSVQYGQPNLIAVLQTLQEIAAAMQYLHSHDIVHGDLTGGNVLLTTSDKDARGFTAKVVDFGLSRVCGEDAVLQTKTMGCAEYMPPELITGGILTKASDVYAFGVIIWEIYVGRRAWEGLQPAAVLKKVASHEMLVFPIQTPHRLKLLGEKCIMADPAQRPTFVEILSEVNAILGDTMSILQQFLHATACNTSSGAAT